MSSVFDEILKLWDQQQEFYHRYRVERFDALFDLLVVTGSSRFRIVDLASGPGSLSLRFLQRFPGSETVMVDQDPVLLRVSREVFKNLKADVTWKESDVTESRWSADLPEDAFDAVMSTTALHWLDERGLSKVFEYSYRLLRPGGLFVNGDQIHHESEEALYHDYEKKCRELNAAKRSPEMQFDWDQFWERIRSIPDISGEMKMREKIYPSGSSHGFIIPLEKQIELLEKTGFNVLGTVWSRFSDRVFVAYK